MTTIDTYLELDPELLTPSADNLRRNVDDIDDLVASVRSVGIIEPLVITGTDNGWHVIAGHRRLEAALQAELDTVPCVVRDVTDAERTEIMLVENLQRTGLAPTEEADGYARLVELGHTQRDIANRVGCNQSHVSKRLKLRQLPAVAAEHVDAGRLDIHDALKLATLPTDQAESLFDDGRIPAGWQIDNQLRKYRADVAEQRGIASGCTRVTMTNGLVECDEADAEYFTLTFSTGALTWYRTAVGDEVEHDTGPAPDPQPEVEPDVQVDDDEREEAEPAPEEVAETEEGPDDDAIRAAVDVLVWLQKRAEAADDRPGRSELIEAIGRVSFSLHSILRRTDWVALPKVSTEADNEMFVYADPPADEGPVTPPWSSFDVAGVDRLIKTIEQLDNADRIRHAIAYEEANGGRAPVLNALDERLFALADGT